MPVPIPRVEKPELLGSHLEAFHRLIEILRVNCPWDKKQTHKSISHLLIEECYETVSAIEAGDDLELKKELGDILLHVVMHAVMAEERKAFSLVEVFSQVFDKLVYRHPHVFGETNVKDDQEVKRNWEALKMKEGRTSILEGVPRELPGLLRAQRIQEKVAAVGFDWSDKRDVWRKVEEELAELSTEIEAVVPDPDRVRDEFGDVFFALTNAARFEGIVAEEAVQSTNRKFSDRFRFMEEEVGKSGLDMKSMTLLELDVFWEKAKERERQKSSI